VTTTSVRNWFAPDHPIHVLEQRVRWYPLPEVVARLRERRKRGLAPGSPEMAALVEHDTAERENRPGADDLWLGERALERAADFFACLAGEETIRARALRAEVRKAALGAGLQGCGIDRLSQSALNHPAAVRWILTGQADELPVGDAGWSAWVTALWCVNPVEETNSNEAA
jgi:hypothetical protein